MKYRQTDYNWEDWHTGLTPQRAKRLEQIIESMLNALEKILKKHHKKGQHLRISVPQGVFAKGVRGDSPMYAPIAILQYKQWPGYEFLEKISQEITNTMPISHVITSSFELRPIPKSRK